MDYQVKDAHAILEYEPRLPRLIGQGAQRGTPEIEFSDFVVHWILLRIVFITDWFSQHGVELAAFVFTLVVTIVGWVLEHRSSKEQNKERKDDIRLLREQLDSLQRQATTLEEQTAMQRADHDRPPFSDAEWVRGSIRRVRIGIT